MPIYEYRCEACDQKHEVLQKLADPVLTECPACGEDRLRKLISAVGFRLAGSGWYETDFKGKDQQRNIAGGTESSKESGKDGKQDGDAKNAASAGATSKDAGSKDAGSKDASSSDSKTSKPSSSDSAGKKGADAA